MEVVKRKILELSLIVRYLLDVRKLRIEEFIERAKLIHGDKYDYSKVNYVNNKTKISIICPIHGEFEQTPNCHLDNQGCPNCGNESFRLKKMLTIQEFVNQAKLIHGSKYDYSNVIYKGYDDEVKIICPTHGEFEQTPHSHLNGSGCQRCGNVKPKSLDEIIQLSKSFHGDKYDYSKTKYINAKTKIKIICPEHGEFEQLHNHHILGQGCPICKESKGEKIIRLFLKTKGIKFIKQKRFKECKDIRPLPFDFYLPEHNICIEYDGEQHFRPIKRFGGDAGYQKILKTDKIKNNFCLKNGFKLIRVKYNDDVNEKLNHVFCY